MGCINEHEQRLIDTIVDGSPYAPGRLREALAALPPRLRGCLAWLDESATDVREEIAKREVIARREHEDRLAKMEARDKVLAERHRQWIARFRRVAWTSGICATIIIVAAVVTMWLNVAMVPTWSGIALVFVAVYFFVATPSID